MVRKTATNWAIRLTQLVSTILMINPPLTNSHAATAETTAAVKAQPKSRSWHPAALIALLILFHIVANIVWLGQDERTLYGDTGNHARVSLAIFDILRQPSLDLFSRIGDATTFWPPFPYVLSQPLYFLLGVGTDVTVFTTTLFLALAIVFTYLLGRRLYGNSAGLLAAFLFSFYPIVFMLSRTYYPDMALTAMVTITLYLLLRSEAFSRRGFALLFGLSLGLTALTKQAALIMLFAPALIAVGVALSANGRKGWREIMEWRPGNSLPPAGADLAARLTNLALAAAIVLALAAPWYFQKLDVLAFQSSDVRAATSFAGKPYAWYLIKLDESLLILPFVLFAVGLVMALLHPKRHWLPLAWFLGASIVYPLITRQHMRYMLPVLPAVALLSAQWLVTLRRVTVRRVLIGATIIFQVAMFFLMSWGAPESWNKALRVPVQKDYLPFADAAAERPQAIDPLAFLYYQFPPRPHRWPVQTILQTVFADIAKDGRADQPSRLTLLSKIPDFEFSSFSYETDLARRLGRTGAANLVVGDVLSDDDYLADFMDSDYVLYKEGHSGFPTNRPKMPLVQEAWKRGDPAVRGRFDVIGRWQLQDGTIAELLKRNGPLVADLPADQKGPILTYLLEQTPQSKQVQRLASGAPMPANASEPAAPPAAATAPQPTADAAQAIIAQSQTQLQAGDAATAEATLRRGVQQVPNPAAVWLALGQLLGEQDRVKDAEEAFQNAVRLAPGDAIVYIEQATFYEGLARSATGEVAERYWTAARDAHQRAMDLNPTLVRPYTGLAQYYRMRKEYSTAIDLYQRGLATIPNDPWLTFGLAQTYNESGEPELGLPYYQQAVQLQPGNALFQQQFGNVASQLQRWDEAMVAYREALRLKPDYARDANFLTAMGFADLKRNQFETAAQSFQQVLDLDPKNQSARFYLGQALEGTGDVAGARLAYETLVQQTPDSELGKRATERLQALKQ